LKKENNMERSIDEILDEVFALIFGKDW